MQRRIGRADCETDEGERDQRPTASRFLIDCSFASMATAFHGAGGVARGDVLRWPELRR